MAEPSQQSNDVVEQLTPDGPVRWSDIPVEPIAEVGKFLDDNFLDGATSIMLDHDRTPRRPEIGNFIRCLSPAVAAVVRRTYLVKNQRFLENTLFGRGANFDERITMWLQCNEAEIADVLRGNERFLYHALCDFPDINRTKKKLLSKWLACNEADWKKRCIDWRVTNPESPFFVHLTVAQFRSISSVDNEFGALICRGLTKVGIQDERLGQKAIDSAPILLSVENQPTYPLEHSASIVCQNIGRNISQGPTVRMGLMHYTDFFFSNAEPVIRCGAVEALRYMIEDAQVVSAGDMIPYPRDLRNRDSAGGIISREVPLLVYAAMGEHRQDCSRYLLSRHDTDVNVAFEVSPFPGPFYHLMTPLHFCASSADVPLSTLRLLISNQNIELSSYGDQNGVGMAVHPSVLILKSTMSLAAKLAKLNLLLSAGADPTSLISHASKVADEDYLENRARRWKELVLPIINQTMEINKVPAQRDRKNIIVLDLSRRSINVATVVGCRDSFKVLSTAWGSVGGCFVQYCDDEFKNAHGKAGSIIGAEERIHDALNRMIRFFDVSSGLNGIRLKLTDFSDFLDLDMIIPRSDFHSLCKVDFRMVPNVLQAALRGSDLSTHDIDQVVLFGHSTFNTIVQSLIWDFFRGQGDSIRFSRKEGNGDLPFTIFERE